MISDPEQKTKLWLALERSGQIIATSKDSEGIEDLSSYYVESNEWKTEMILYEKHSLIKEAFRGDTLRVMSTTEVKNDGAEEANDYMSTYTTIVKKKGSLKKKGSFKKMGTLKRNPAQTSKSLDLDSNADLKILDNHPTLEKFKLKVTILPPSLTKGSARNLGGCLVYCLPAYIKCLMDQVKIAVEESVLETMKFTSEQRKHALSVISMPFYAFCEGPRLITDMENVCKSHFEQLLTSKICGLATDAVPNLKIAEKTAMLFVQSKKWKIAKDSFHQQIKNGNENENQSEKDSSRKTEPCTIS